MPEATERTTGAPSRIYAIARVSVAFVWIYHGLVPKLLFAHPAESEILVLSGVSTSHAGAAVMIAGIAEIALGLLMLIAWRARSLFVVSIALMLVALLSVAAFAPGYLIAAFNPVTLNILVVALSVIGLLAAPR